MPSLLGWLSCASQWHNALTTLCFPARTCAYASLATSQAFRDEPFNKNLVLLLHVHHIALGRRGMTLQSVGWTALPIFDDKGFVQSGSKQVPLFQGAPSKVGAHMAIVLQQCLTRCLCNHCRRRWPCFKLNIRRWLPCVARRMRGVAP